MKLVVIMEVFLGLKSSLDTAAVCYLVSRTNANLFPDRHFGKEDNLIFTQCHPQIINVLNPSFEFLIGFSSKQLELRVVKFHNFSRCN